MTRTSVNYKRHFRSYQSRLTIAAILGSLTMQIMRLRSVFAASGNKISIHSFNSQPDGDADITFRYLSEDTSDNGHYLRLAGRKVASNTRVDVTFKPDTGAVLANLDGGVWTQLDSNSGATTAQDTWYNVRVVYDGTSVDVWRREDGELPEKILSSTAATVTSSANMSFTVNTGGQFQIDDIRVINDSLSNTTTYAVTNANELTSMTGYNGATSFTYDAWGRMTGKTRGSQTAAYAREAGGLLTGILRV